MAAYKKKIKARVENSKGLLGLTMAMNKIDSKLIVHEKQVLLKEKLPKVDELKLL